MFQNKETTPISELGEFGLINHLTQHIKTERKSTVTGVGDDASVVQIGDEYCVQSSEIFAENVDFDLTFHPLKHLGYKMVVATISDVLAMNVIPSHLLVNIALSSRFTLEAIEELYAGILIACKEYNLDLVGGDTGSSQSGLVVSMTATGFTKNKESITYRGGAKSNDLLVSTGDLGGAYMGLQILEREKKIFLEHKDMQPDLEKYDYIVGRQLRPLARLDVVQTLQDLNIIPTSMMDISDGVASEINHMGTAGKVGFNIYEQKLPIDPQTLDVALEFNLNPSIVALNGGDDYELLMTIDQKHFDKIKGNPDLTVIGHVTESAGAYNMVTQADQVFPIEAQGFSDKS
ncbi:MAG: thiamine-phosphate kinase [Bacteroidia bacterium]|nr:thiamine-phosphate kinase [Bacteroidia bacterium]